MNQDEIIRMAREACSPHQVLNTDLVFLERFAALVAEAERNACIAECMEQHRASIEAAEKAKRVRDQDAYINTATGAKFSAVRIMQRGVSK